MWNRLSIKVLAVIVVMFFLCVPSFDVAGQPIPGRSDVTIRPERVQLLGIKSEVVAIRDLTKKIRTVGIVEVDETRISHVQTKFQGWIEELYVDFVGMQVKRGQPLFSVYSNELFAAQEEYLLALKDLAFPIKGRFALEFYEASKSLLESSRKRLHLWDISQEQIANLEQTKSPTKTLVIHSPINGVVLAKKAFIGMNVASGLNTYTIADLSKVWVLSDIYEDDLSHVQLGQRAELQVASLSDKKFYGKVTFVDYVVDSGTRTTKVRLEFDNSDYQLKPGMYTITEFSIPMGCALALPEEALIDTGQRKLVFVDKGSGRFEPREVKLAFKAGPFYKVLSGVFEGDKVVVSSQFLVDSESRLKALAAEGMKGHGVG